MAQTYEQALIEQNHARELDLMRRLQSLESEQQPQVEPESLQPEAPEESLPLQSEVVSSAGGQAAIATPEATDSAAKYFAKKAQLRILTGSMAASLYFLIIAYMIWTVQLFFGNLLKSKLVPKLDLWEIIIWAVVSLLIIGSIIMQVAILAAFSDWPGIVFEAVKYFSSSIIDFIKGIL